MAFGRHVAQVAHFDRARCVLALAADPFSDGPGAVRHAMDWSSARAAVRDGAAAAPAPMRFAAEATPGLFGARADHRVALSPTRIEGLLCRVAAHWMPELTPAAGGLAGPAPPGVEARPLPAWRGAGPSARGVGGAGLSAEAH